MLVHDMLHGIFSISVFLIGLGLELGLGLRLGFEIHPSRLVGVFQL